ncbi:urease accessory protein UreD [Uliginosibacterium sp. sgz301328]|uniref:urease accessory protein UreD n=1 Tax=Uliginosibacterium sp. sgz301328 TaxID=3243764 RepID=UPI00359D4C94
MSAPLPHPLLAPQTHAEGWRARLTLDFERRQSRSVLARRLHDGPLVVQKPLYPEGDDICHAVLVHPPGGIVSGDQLRIDVTAHAGAHALITTPGATKWYRSLGPISSQTVNINVDANAIVEWLPQENIVFDAARATMRTHLSLTGNARLMGWEIACLGRQASGERFARGELGQSIDLCVDGELAWCERMRLSGDDALMQSPAGLAGNTVFGTMWLAGCAPDRILLERLREPVFVHGTAATTALPRVTLVRAMSHSSEALRAYFATLWECARPYWLQRPARRPRIWAT